MKYTLEERLDMVFTADPALSIAMQQRAFDAISGTGSRSLVLMGAGALGRRTLAGLRRSGVEPLAFGDNNSRLWGTQVDGLTVLSPETAVAHYGAAAVFAVTVFNPSKLAVQCRQLGASRVISYAPLHWAFADALLPFCDLALPQTLGEHGAAIHAAMELWADDESRDEFVSQLEWRFTLDSPRQPPHRPPAETYFPKDLVAPSPHETFIDCGAFAGDTLPGFVDFCAAGFERYVAIEPDPSNCRRLRQAIVEEANGALDRFVIKQAAVGEVAGKRRFDSAGDVCSGFSHNGGIEVDCVTLDDVAFEYPPTFIKMDIEGAEPAALAGARRTLAEHSPVLAVCLYHAPEHLWAIPLAIARANSDYRLFLRRYAEDCWELVCYAVPARRLAEF
jgi:FkbM family methyltransferase